MNSDLFLSVETMEVMDGKKLKSIKPNDKGYYTIPAMAFGYSAYNRGSEIYEPSSVVDAITNDQSVFNIQIREGNLFGEWGHPNEKDGIERILKVDEKYVSHHIRRIFQGPKLNNNLSIIMMEIKPYGPYGSYLKESLEDPDINTATSLRSLARINVDPATKQVMKQIMRLVTIDAVTAPGFTQSSKRYVETNNSMESFKIPVTMEDFYTSDKRLISCEHLTDKDVLSYFNATEIIIKKEIIGVYPPNFTNAYIGHDNNKHSVAHAMFSIK